MPEKYIAPLTPEEIAMIDAELGETTMEGCGGCAVACKSCCANGLALLPGEADHLRAEQAAGNLRSDVVVHGSWVSNCLDRGSYGCRMREAGVHVPYACSLFPVATLSFDWRGVFRLGLHKPRELCPAYQSLSPEATAHIRDTVRTYLHRFLDRPLGRIPLERAVNAGKIFVTNPRILAYRSSVSVPGLAAYEQES
jgi:hypothetical protein